MSESNSAAPAASSPMPSPAEVANLTIENSSQISEPGTPVVADLKDQATNGTPQEKVVAQKMLRQLKIKFNGKEINEDLPFDIPDTDDARNYMSKQLQMSKLAQSKSQEYSKLESEVRTFVDELKKNPRKILSDPNIGVDIKQFAAQILQEEIENSQKSPEQLEREKLETELKSLKEERESEKEANRKRDLARLEQQEFDRYDHLMTKALEQHKDLPPSPYVIKKMADYMLLGIEKGIDVTPEDVIPLVKEEMREDLKAMFAVMPEDVIEQLVGKETINKLRKKSVARAKGAANPVSTKSIADTGQKSSNESSSKSGKKTSFKDFFGV